MLLAETQGVSVVRRLQLVGHSLGAHLVGFLAKQVQKLGLGRVARITALDPARPLFRSEVSFTPASRAPTAVLAQEAQGRVDRSDADLVQVIHSDAGGLGLEVRQSLRLELQTNHRSANFSQSLIWPFPG